MEAADYLRRHGPFMPHRLHAEDMEYTTLPSVLKKVADRFTEKEIVPKGESRDISDSAE